MNTDIFKPGAKLIIEIIDMSDPKVIKEIEDIHREQDEILERKKIDPEFLKLVINI